MEVTIKHPCILVDPSDDYAQMDVFEGESRIYRGIRHTYGKVLAKDWSVLSWYDYKVDTSRIIRAPYTDPKTFVVSWLDCYIVDTRVKRFGQTKWVTGSFFLPTSDWDTSDGAKDGDLTELDDQSKYDYAMRML